jgi:hypothetical protein
VLVDWSEGIEQKGRDDRPHEDDGVPEQAGVRFDPFQSVPEPEPEPEPASASAGCLSGALGGSLMGPVHGPGTGCDMCAGWDARLWGPADPPPSRLPARPAPHQAYAGQVPEGHVVWRLCRGARCPSWRARPSQVCT